MSPEEIAKARELKTHHWSVRLWVECPECGEDFDHTDVDDWHDGFTAHIGEAVDHVETKCTKCGHEFAFIIGAGL